MTGNAISRRHLLAASGAGSAALVLSACGAAAAGDPEETEPEREAEVLNGVLAGQLAVAAAADDAAAAQRGAELGKAFESLKGKRERSTTSLANAVDELGGKPTEQIGEVAAAESAVESLGLTVDASTATALEAIAEITTDAYRQLVHRAITEDAAYRALVADTLGEDLAPTAFPGAAS